MHRWSGDRWNVLDQSFVNVKDYGVIGDGITDDTAVLQNILYNIEPGRMYLPAGTYVISDTLIVPFREWAIFGEGTDNDLNGSQSIIKSTQPDKDYIRVEASGFNIRNITFSPYSGADAVTLSVTENTITLDRIVNVNMATSTLTQMLDGQPVFRYGIYMNNNQLYRLRSPNSSVTILPTHSSGSVIVGGLQWDYYGTGNTVTFGVYANGTSWAFTGITGNTLTGVYPLGSLEILS